MSPPEPKVVNSLLRCTRADRRAHPLFECVRADLHLWVWELGPFTDADASWSVWLDVTLPSLRENLTLLASLRSESDDYALHIVVASEVFQPLRLPQEMIEVAHCAGFAIEIFHEVL